MKLKIRLIYSALLLIFSLFLIVSLSMGWFNQAYTVKINSLLSYQPGISNLEFYKSIDENKDGQPDLDEYGNVIYALQSTKQIIISNFYPHCSMKFRIVVPKSDTTNYISIGLNEINVVDGIEIANAFKISFTNPTTNQTINNYFSNLMTDRSIRLLNNCQTSINNNFIFDYTIYMADDAGNEYKGESLVINEVSVTSSQ